MELDVKVNWEFPVGARDGERERREETRTIRSGDSRGVTIHDARVTTTDTVSYLCIDRLFGNLEVKQAKKPY